MRTVLVIMVVLLVCMGVLFHPKASGGETALDPNQPLSGHCGTCSTPGTGEVSSNNWLCRKCRTLVQAADKPSSGYCPAGGHHQWNNLGRVANTLYNCSKCNITVASKNKPSSGYCPAGGLHRWHRLSN